jgi:iron transport multicopper oxidase
VVEVVINNQNTQLNSGHPWHLHGHRFQVVARSQQGDNSTYTGQNLPEIPMKRDVAGVRPQAYLVIRFRADNPGINLLHCHIEWHVQAGLTATFVEAVDRIQYTAPPDHIDACVRQNIPTSGNAAGHLWNINDLNGANVDVPETDHGAMWKDDVRVEGKVRKMRKTRVAVRPVG